MSVNLEGPESRDDLEAVVDGLAAVSTLSQYLPIFEPGDDVLDAGADTAVLPVVGIVDDPAAVVALWADDDSDAAVSAIAQDDTVIGQVHNGAAGDDDVVAVTWPALADNDHPAPVSVDDDRNFLRRKPSTSVGG